MKPKIVVHNSVSLNGSLVNFLPKMPLHYTIAGNHHPQAHLVGSNSVKVGIQIFENTVPPEKEEDFIKPTREGSLVYWVIPDTEAALKGLLHVCRRFEYCKDIIVLISEETPKTYIEYLKERNYDFFVAGKSKVDFKQAFEWLSSKYGVDMVVTDAGRILTNLLLKQNLVDEVSILVHPLIVAEPYRMFDGIGKSVNLKLKKAETMEDNYVWLVYAVEKQPVSQAPLKY